ncbi:MAG: 3-hydroxybutyryl-CoA dehydrogenase [Bdellovibrionales bacterium]|nr:3-hydroxybutyryl-CoA dehydrogenase [Bdellovibrionales bacterium]
MNISIIGAGQMGAGIAQVLAQKNHSVILIDQNSEVLKNALAVVANSCDRLIKKEKISTKDKDKILSLITCVKDLNHAKDSDFVIEAVSENTELKLKIFKELDKICNPKTILCSNTSSISITKIAGQTNRPDKVMGMHFMNPVPVMKLVEGIKALQTSNETFLKVKNLAESLDKVFIESSKDMPGFIINRILMPMINEAIYAFHEGVASVKDIDLGMKLGTNQPMGPLALADFIGLDTCLSIMKVLNKEFGGNKYSPCPLLVKYVEAGWLGKKTGKGFYSY